MVHIGKSKGMCTGLMLNGIKHTETVGMIMSWNSQYSGLTCHQSLIIPCYDK